MNVSTRFTQHTQTDVLLHYNTPSFEKTAFPSSGTENEPAVVVKNSVLEYTLKITNPDTEVPMTDIALSDTMDASLVKVNDDIRVKLGDSEGTHISSSVHIKSYSLALEDGYYKFNAVVSSLDPGDTISIIIPVTVAGEKDAHITNTAQITSINDAALNISSNTDYHIIEDPQVKILKVNSKDEPLANAKLKILNDDAEQTDAEIYDQNNAPVGEFYSGTGVVSYSIQPGSYILREVETPDDTIYKYAEDIKFRIDSDGFAHVNGQKTDIIKMVDMPAYKVVFHENQPDHDDVIFRIYEPGDLKGENKMIDHFYDIPTFAGDEYVFAGWYYDDNEYFAENADAADTPVNFESQCYPKSNESNPQDYHIYAKWIEVGKVSKDEKDTNIIGGDYRGFGLAGVQIRLPQMHDSNYNDEETLGGMRFVTSISERLLREINEVSNIQVTTDAGEKVNVEYGYVVGTEENIKTFKNQYHFSDSEYKLQYRGENVNGVDTTGKERTAATDYRYINNVNCTSNVSIYNTYSNGEGMVAKDHRNFDEYRLYTLVVTYEDESASRTGDKLDARAYIRYYDANGKLRVFYNNYRSNMYHGGCMCSYNQVAGMAIPTKEE